MDAAHTLEGQQLIEGSTGACMRTGPDGMVAALGQAVRRMDLDSSHCGIRGALGMSAMLACVHATLPCGSISQQLIEGCRASDLLHPFPLSCTQGTEAKKQSA
jgi:hypothetical protein